MSDPLDHTYPEYLAAKESVDDAARNQSVWRRFVEEITSRGPALRVVEPGGGIGNTAMQILGALRDRSVETVEYTLLDLHRDNLVAARDRLGSWAERNGFEVRSHGEELVVDGPLRASVHLIEADLLEYGDDTSSCDVVVAQALLDLLPLTPALQALQSLGREGSVWYLPLHYDGMTALEPRIDRKIDRQIERLYDESMDGKGDRVGALTGRRLLFQLPDIGTRVLDAGSSDWIVFPGDDGYTADERTFLLFMLRFFESELSNHPSLDSEQFSTWMDTRKEQLAQEELVLISHQIDILGVQGEEGKLQSS